MSGTSEERVETQQNPRANKEAGQAAAICWRLDRPGDVEMLLETSLDTARWIIPKGNCKKVERSHQAAQREAPEESGVVGKAKKKPVGFFIYLTDGQRPTTVAVHLLHTRFLRDVFAERGARTMPWVQPSTSAGMVREPDLSSIFMVMAEASSCVVRSTHHSFDAAKAFKRLLRALQGNLHSVNADIVAAP